MKTETPVAQASGVFIWNSASLLAGSVLITISRLATASLVAAWTIIGFISQSNRQQVDGYMLNQKNPQPRIGLRIFAVICCSQNRFQTLGSALQLQCSLF